jgi:tyrosyl-tRNA synthetase
MLHGDAQALAAIGTAQAVFLEGVGGDELPTLAVKSGQISVVEALVALGLSASKKEARRLILQGGARVNGEAVNDEGAILRVSEQVRLSAGKKKHGLLTP